ncbi:hypothetical protein ANCCEY_13496 [Ancylostoma ceylanicum]|uniref:Uncharacterized protein n=1 Tax=Ancylostoma ceylanicum TaxID=53326 RepID=A0A0D6LC59_9BILA|nr:hypothetical protein ANCCEY_13496 [Ancylostoma ceylanicum]
MIALLVISLVFSAYGAEYSDEFARMLLPLSSAAYVDNPWMCLALHFPKSVIDYSFRVTHWRDVVPHIPSFDERPGGYYHHKTEVFYKEGMAPNDYIVCKEYEDFKCSDGLWVHTSIKNHIKYFGKVIRDWGTAGCL